MTVLVGFLREKNVHPPPHPGRMGQLAKLCTGDHPGADCENMRSAKIILSLYPRMGLPPECGVACAAPAPMTLEPNNTRTHFVPS